MRNIWLSGQSMALFVSSLETKSRLTHLIVPYIASDNLLVNQSLESTLTNNKIKDDWFVLYVKDRCCRFVTSLVPYMGHRSYERQRSPKIILPVTINRDEKSQINNPVYLSAPWEGVARCWSIWMSRALNLLQTKGPLGASQYLVQSYRVVN